MTQTTVSIDLAQILSPEQLNANADSGVESAINTFLAGELYSTRPAACTFWYDDVSIEIENVFISYNYNRERSRIFAVYTFVNSNADLIFGEILQEISRNDPSDSSHDICLKATIKTYRTLQTKAIELIQEDIQARLAAGPNLSDNPVQETLRRHPITPEEAHGESGSFEPISDFGRDEIEDILFDVEPEPAQTRRQRRTEASRETRNPTRQAFDLLSMSDAEIANLFRTQSANVESDEPQLAPPPRPTYVPVETEGSTAISQPTIELQSNDFSIDFGESREWYVGVNVTTLNTNYRNIIEKIARYAKPSFDTAFGESNWEVYCSARNNIQLTVRFPKVQVFRNENGPSTIVRDLFIQMYLTGEASGLKGRRLTITQSEFQSGYSHPHLRRAIRSQIDDTYWTKMSDFCLGSSNTTALLRSFNESLTRDDAGLIVVTSMGIAERIVLLARHESSGGTPYYRLSGRGSFIEQIVHNIPGLRNSNERITTTNLQDNTDAFIESFRNYFREPTKYQHLLANFNYILGGRITEVISRQLFNAADIKKLSPILIDTDGELHYTRTLLGEGGTNNRQTFPTEAQVLQRRLTNGIYFRGTHFNFTVITDTHEDMYVRKLVPNRTPNSANATSEEIDASSMLEGKAIPESYIQKINNLLLDKFKKSEKSKISEQFISHFQSGSISRNISGESARYFEPKRAINPFANRISTVVRMDTSSS